MLPDWLWHRDSLTCWGNLSFRCWWTIARSANSHRESPRRSRVKAAPQDRLTLDALAPSIEPYHLKVDWTDLSGYFRRLESKGTPLNLGTYVGAAQVREAILGDVNRAPTADELEKMKALVAQAMQQ